MNRLCIQFLLLAIITEASISYTCTPNFVPYNAEYINVTCIAFLGTNAVNISMNCTTDPKYLYFYKMDKCTFFDPCNSNTLTSIFLLCNYTQGGILASPSQNCQMFTATETTVWGVLNGFYSSFSYTDPVSKLNTTLNISPWTATAFDKDAQPRDYRSMKWFNVTVSGTSYTGALGFTTQNFFPQAVVTVINGKDYNCGN